MLPAFWGGVSAAGHATDAAAALAELPEGKVLLVVFGAAPSDGLFRARVAGMAEADPSLPLQEALEKAEGIEATPGAGEEAEPVSEDPLKLAGIFRGGPGTAIINELLALLAALGVSSADEVHGTVGAPEPPLAAKPHAVTAPSDLSALTMHENGFKWPR